MWMSRPVPSIALADKCRSVDLTGSGALMCAAVHGFETTAVEPPQEASNFPENIICWSFHWLWQLMQRTSGKEAHSKISVAGDDRCIFAVYRS